MSSFLIAAPEALASASSDLSGVGESVRAASASALSSTTSLVPAAADEVSGAIARLFGGFGAEYQELQA